MSYETPSGLYKLHNEHCTECQKGHSCKGGTMAPCAAGTYASSAGSDSCTRAPPGHTPAARDQIPAPVRRRDIRRQRGISVLSAVRRRDIRRQRGIKDLSAVHPGHYCPKGSTVSDRQCSGGYYCTGGNTTEKGHTADDSDDKKCQAGYYCPSAASRTRDTPPTIVTTKYALGNNTAGRDSQNAML